MSRPNLIPKSKGPKILKYLVILFYDHLYFVIIKFEVIALKFLMWIFNIYSSCSYFKNSKYYIYEKI